MSNTVTIDGTTLVVNSAGTAVRVNTNVPNGVAGLDSAGNISNGAVLATGATTARTLGAMAADNPTGATFGVLPDTTGAIAPSNTANFQTALTNSVRLSIPSNLSFQTNAATTLPENNGRLELDGTIKLAANSNSSVLALGGNTIMQGIGVLDGNKSGNPSSPANVAILSNIYNESNIVVRDVTLQNGFGWNFNMGGYSGTIVSRIVFDNVRSIGGSDAPEFFNATASGFWRGNVTGGTDYGIAFYGDVSASFVCDSYFNNNTGFASIGCYSDSGQPNPCSNNIFSRNIILNATIGIAHVVSSGGNHTNILTYDNLIVGASNFAIDIGNVAGSETSRNYIFGPSTKGVVVQGSSSGTRISNNRFREINGTAITQAGGGSLLIDGNYFDDDQTTPTLTSGFAQSVAPSVGPIWGMNYVADTVAAASSQPGGDFSAIFGFFGTASPAVPTICKPATNKTSGYSNVGLSIVWNMLGGSAATSYLAGGPYTTGGEHTFYTVNNSGDLVQNIGEPILTVNSAFVAASVPYQLPKYTVSTLPAGVEGMRAYVTDATAPTFLGTLTGGGSVVSPVFYNGTAWVAG